MNPRETLTETDRLKDRLWRAHRRNAPIGRGAYLSNGEVFVAGLPYLFTNFAERAFVFANAEQANALLDEFPVSLGGFTAGVWGEK